VGGQIAHTAEGEPTGILLETAATASSAMFPITARQTEAEAVKAMQMLNRAGVIGIKEASTNQALCALEAGG
jgi:predicted amidohydrolase YtcJ